jgi:site-specific DNA-methyltransferase (adenine-specific)
LETKFARALISLMKSTQQAMKKVYSHLPLQDFSKPWTDAELYKKYALNDHEISKIEESVSLIGSGDGD